MMATTTYLWDSVSDNVLSENDDVTTTVFSNEPIQFGDLVSQHNGTATNFYQFDARGDTRELTDASETATDTRLYDAWGNVIHSTGTTPTPFQFGAKFGYTFNAALHLISVRSHWYKTELGRWITVASASTIDSPDAFVYHVNEPIRRNLPIDGQTNFADFELPFSSRLALNQISSNPPIVTARQQREGIGIYLKLKPDSNGCDRVRITFDFSFRPTGSNRPRYIMEARFKECTLKFGCCKRGNGCFMNPLSLTQLLGPFECITIHERFAMGLNNKGTYQLMDPRVQGKPLGDDVHSFILPNRNPCDAKWCGTQIVSGEIKVFPDRGEMISGLKPIDTPTGNTTIRPAEGGVSFDRPGDIASASYQYSFASCCCDSSKQNAFITVSNPVLPVDPNIPIR